MAISSPGVGSGLDVNSIVTKLMAIERQPLDSLATKQTGYNNQISSLGKVKSAIAALQTAASAISSSSKIYSYKGVVADTTVASASTTSSAVAGTYSIEVERLAGTHKLLSAAAADPSAGGTLTIEIGSTAGGSFVPKSGTSAIPVTIAAGATLASVRDAINSADAGVSAAIVNGASGQQLVLTSKNSGETSQMKITATAGLSAFSFEPLTQAGGLTQKDAGQNAILRVDGILINDTSSNTVIDAVTGVTLNLTKTNLGSPTQLSISNDTTSLQTKLQAFVKAYNDINSTVKDLSKYDSTTKTSGPLNGDTTISSLTSQLRNALFTSPAGASSDYQHLADLGISFQTDGSLALDSTKLQNAIDKNLSGVVSTVAAYGTAFNTLTTAMNSTDGLITARTNGINTSLQRLQDRSDQLTRNLAQVEKRYRAQFTALDTLMGQLSTTSSYLTQQLSSLSK